MPVTVVRWRSQHMLLVIALLPSNSVNKEMLMKLLSECKRLNCKTVEGGERTAITIMSPPGAMNRADATDRGDYS